MRRKFKRFIWLTVLTFCLINVVDICLPVSPTGAEITFSSAAQARSSGGRSGGGSFKSTPSRSSTSSRTSTSSTPSRSSTSSRTSTSSTPSRTRSNVSSPTSSYSSSSSSSGDTVILPRWADLLISILLIFLLICVVVGVIYAVLVSVRTFIQKMTDLSKVINPGEVENDTVTVSKLQVALLAEARTIQSHLSAISLDIDTSTPEGLLQLLQESALALLRSPENWTHVLASSQTVQSRDAAESLFSKLSIEERSKFSVETLSNVGGRVRKQAFKPDPNEDPAAYIVVTLLIGTADDKPLFTEIRSTTALEAALEQVAAMQPDYLMVFELLWSPQEATDSLTYDELLTEYTDMIQIA